MKDVAYATSPVKLAAAPHFQSRSNEWSIPPVTPSAARPMPSPGDLLRANDLSMSPLVSSRPAVAAVSPVLPEQHSRATGGQRPCAVSPGSLSGSTGSATHSPVISRTKSPPVPLFHDPLPPSPAWGRDAHSGGRSEKLGLPPHPRTTSGRGVTIQSSSDGIGVPRVQEAPMAPTSPGLLTPEAFRRRNSDPAVRSPLAPRAIDVSETVKTPTRRATISSASPSTATPPAHHRAVQSPPSSSEAAVLMQRIVDVYCKAMSVYATVSGSPTAAGPTSADLLRSGVASADWPTLGAALLARAHAAFVACFGRHHAAVANVLKLQGLLHAHVGANVGAVVQFRAGIAMCESGDVEVDAGSVAGLKYNLGLCLMATSDYAAAALCFRDALSVYTLIRDPGDPLVQQLASKLQQATRSGMELQYTRLQSDAMGAFAEKRYGDAHTAFTAALVLLPEDAQTAYHLATCCAHIGCCGSGLTWFTAAVRWGYCDFATAGVDPNLAPLHTQPRFWELCARGGGDGDSDGSDDDGVDVE